MVVIPSLIALARTRASVECLFGVWKRRFASLSSTTGPLRFRNIEDSATVINCCAVLQNFIVKSRLSEENDDVMFEVLISSLIITNYVILSNLDDLL